MTRFIAVFAWFWMTLSVAWAGDLTIAVSHPTDGDAVEQRPLVEGKVSDSQAKVWVIVHPTETSKVWVQPPVDVKKNGTCKVQLYLRDPGRAHVGTRFSINAVANPRQELREPTDDPLSGWPVAEAESD